MLLESSRVHSRPIWIEAKIIGRCTEIISNNKSQKKALDSCLVPNNYWDKITKVILVCFILRNNISFYLGSKMCIGNKRFFKDVNPNILILNKKHEKNCYKKHFKKNIKKLGRDFVTIKWHTFDYIIRQAYLHLTFSSFIVI